jgi:hypothetical protein
MTSLVILSGVYFPVFTVIFLIVAVIRLIVRLSNRDSSSSTNYKSTYKPPVPPPGQNQNTGANQFPNTGNNPYQQQGNNPYQQPGNNPYQAPGTNNPYQAPNPNPYQAPNPNPYQNAGPNPYQTPGPNPYQTPGQGSPYQQPTYGTQTSSTDTHRSTAIPGQQQYNPYVPAPKKPNTGLILGIVGGVVALFIGFGVIMYIRTQRSQNLVRSHVTLSYENPTNVSYTIILDGWDSIKVAPYSGSTDIDYTYREDQDTVHWKMVSETGDVTLDTVMQKSDLEAWYNERESKGDYTANILLNPSGSEYVFWTLWYGSAGDDYLDVVELDDSTYFIDAYVVTDPIIYDERNSSYKTDLDDAKQYSSDDEAEFLVNAADFRVLYDRIYLDDEKYDVFNRYRNTLIRLYNAGVDHSNYSSTTDYSEQSILSSFDLKIPSSIDENTTASDFVSAIDYFRSQETYFKGVDRDLYRYADDSATFVLDGDFNDSKETVSEYHEMHYVTYDVDHTGFWNDIPKRSVSYEMDRETSSGAVY